MKKTKLTVFAILAALLLTSLMSSLAVAVSVPAFTLSSSSSQLQYTISSGTTFNGSIVTTGTLRFWVSAPNKEEIVNLGLIDNGTFSFVAHQSGVYILNFENDLPTPIQVSFSYTSNSDINNSTGLLLPLTTYLYP